MNGIPFHLFSLVVYSTGCYPKKCVLPVREDKNRNQGGEHMETLNSSLVKDLLQKVLTVNSPKEMLSHLLNLLAAVERNVYPQNTISQSRCSIYFNINHPPSPPPGKEHPNRSKFPFRSVGTATALLNLFQQTQCSFQRRQGLRRSSF